MNLLILYFQNKLPINTLSWLERKKYPNIPRASNVGIIRTRPINHTIVHPLTVINWNVPTTPNTMKPTIKNDVRRRPILNIQARETPPRPNTDTQA